MERVEDPADPRLRDFLHLRDSELRRAKEASEGIFVAEGLKAIRRAVAAGYVARAVLCVERRASELGQIGAPLLVVADDVLDATAGFPVHRGALASFDRRPLPSPEALVTSARRLVACEDLVDPTNLGLLFRSAAALGWDAAVLTPRCADPLYRRAIKTSMGAVFTLPWTRIGWREGAALLRGNGFTLAALTPAPEATPIGEVPEGIERLALAFGSEGLGLSRRWLDEADVLVRIPMAAGIDSLNVAAAAAVAFHALGPGGGRHPVAG